jgi:hypothetical protein
MSLWKTVHERSLADLLSAERTRRAAIEADRMQLVELLIDLARKHDGPRLEEHWRQTPQGPLHWSAPEWIAFFQADAPGETDWGKSLAVETAPSGDKAKDKMVNALQARIIQLESVIADLRLKDGEKPPAEAPETPIPDTQTPDTQTPDTPTPGTQSPTDIPTGPLDDFAVPRLSMKYKPELQKHGYTDLRWRRGAMQLYLIATLGINAHLELDSFIAPKESLSYRTNSTKKPLQMLKEAGMLHVETLRLQQGEFKMALRVARLTDLGREMCASFGWTVVSSDWDRLIEHHQGESQKEHTLAVIYFAMLARVRGWATQIAPDRDGPATPDLVVIGRGQKHLVEVELSARGGQKQTRKWRNLAEAQGHVALCAPTAKVRGRLVGDCKLAKLNGVATDLESLNVDEKGERKRFYNITPDDPLWVEEF